MNRLGSATGIGAGIIQPVTLRLSGTPTQAAPEKPAASTAVEPTGKTSFGKPTPLNGLKAKAESQAGGDSESTGDKTLDALQKAIEMAKRQLELAQQQLRAVEAQSKGGSEADQKASQAAREAAQANVAAASAALTSAYAAYTDALKKAGEGSGGVSARA